MKIRHVTALGLVAVVGVLPASGALARDHASKRATVTLKNIAFKPKVVTIARGGTVTWVWRDGNIPHNVKGPGFKSKTQSKGTYRHTFKRKGTFTVVCTLHLPGMKMKVKVV